MTGDCKHEHTQLRWFTASNGARHLRYQCLNCGRDPGGFRAIASYWANGSEPEWDATLQDKFYSKFYVGGLSQ